MSIEIEQAIKLAIKRLVSQIARNGQLVRFETKLQQRKHYDILERSYIENQRLRKELGNEYESSDSEQEKENDFNNMSKVELKKLMRKRLVDKKFDEDVLQPIPDNMQGSENDDYLTTTKHIEEGASCADLKSIREAKEVEDEEEKQTNFGLLFLIQELEKIQKTPVQMVESCNTSFTS